MKNKKQKNKKSKKDYNSDLTLTVESRIEKDEVLYQSLEEYAVFYNYLERRIFNILFNVGDDFDKDFKNELKRSFLEEYDIHARFLESILIEAKGKLKSSVELQNKNLEQARRKLKKTQKTINKFSNQLERGYRKKKSESFSVVEIQQIKNTLHYLNQKRNKLEDRIKYYKTKNTVFGTRNFFKKQRTDEKYINNHGAWLGEWRRRRNLNFYHIGGSCETRGNSLCQYFNDGGMEYLRITMPYFYQNKYLLVHVKFTTERETKKKHYAYFQEAMANGVAMSYRFLKKENGYWYVQANFTLKRHPQHGFNGYLGVDINYGLFATAEVDNKGNYCGVFKDYEYDSTGKSSEQIEQMISAIVNEIVDKAKQLNKDVSIEDIDLEDKRAGNNKSANNKVNSIEYNLFKTLMINRCLKEGVYLHIVNPAYTSIIGKYKYEKRFGVSRHIAAAIVIARRGGGFKERIPGHMACILHSGEPEKWNVFRYRHRWSQWNFLDKNLPTCLKKFNSASGSRVASMNNLRRRFRPGGISFPARLENIYAVNIFI